jgi:hypothetical protein
MLALVDQLVAIASIYVAVEIPCGTFDCASTIHRTKNT